jgi:hypothetical protein
VAGPAGHLEGEESEEWLVVSVGVHFFPISYILDDVNGALFEDLGAVDPTVLVGHLLALPEIDEGGRIIRLRLVVPVVGEVVLAAEVEPKEGVESAVSWSVL